MIPDMDGWHITAEIRKFSSVPVLILSVIDNPGLVARALDAGADDYLIKPAARNMLIAHINNLVRRNVSNKIDSPLLQVNPATSLIA